MGIDEKKREQAILDTATELLLRHGYNKMTMSDVADAVDLHRGLVYLHFPSKDELVEVLMLREMNTYAEVWNNYLEADPLGGSVASIYRSMVHALKQLPLMAAIYIRDEQTFGKYLRKPNSIFARWPTTSHTHDFLRVMQEVGAVRQDINTHVVAFILDALTPSILQTLASDIREPHGNNRPSYDELMETVAEMLERMLTPSEGAHLEAGKAVLHQGIVQIRAQLMARMEQQKQG